MLLLYIFSHNLPGLVEQVYRWTRLTGVGEITAVEGGFYRVFFQSHIFVLVGFFVFFYIFIYRAAASRAVNTDTGFLKSFLGSKSAVSGLAVCILFAAVNVLNFSRSNWIGLAGGAGLMFFYIWRRFRLKNALAAGFWFASSFLLGFILIILVVKFPIPNPLGGFSASGLLSQRATNFTGEAALTSRWELFPPLFKEIKKAPILGAGFGATVTYNTSDPRALAGSVTGKYTTYAFEWGWFDIWLKLGLFGLVAYIALLLKLVITGLAVWPRSGDAPAVYIPALAISLAAVSAVSFFSPYLNHPLGIGYLLIAAAFISSRYEKQKRLF